MCGIEVHQQLATGKLHSRQSGELYDITIDTLPEQWPRFERRLRASRSEGGAVDVAARFESKRNRTFVYAQSPNAGLIELDEQPPLALDEDALDISLTVAALLQSKPVSLIQTMRKTVVDGSNTSGFQRTSLIATDGTLETDEGTVGGVDVVCLEEDSARKLDTVSTTNGQQVIYNLDRLGLPLIEIATSPDVVSPDHAKSTAMALGRRSSSNPSRAPWTRKHSSRPQRVHWRRGSRRNQGCQDLNWIPRIIRLEMARQLHFYRLANDLRTMLSLPALPPHRDLDDSTIEHQVAEAVKTHLPLSLQDVSDVFSSTDSGRVADGLANGAVVLALPLKGLLGRLGAKSLDDDGAQLPRLGRGIGGCSKISWRQRHLPFGRTSRLRHHEQGSRRSSQSDEPRRGRCLCPVLRSSVASHPRFGSRPCPRSLGLASHSARSSKRRREEGRSRRRDHITHAPASGRSRMYPETDVPPQMLSSDAWQGILTSLPMSDDERSQRLNGYEMSTDQCEQLLARELDDVFCDHVGSLPAKAWAALLLNHDDQHPETLANILQLREEGALARDHVDGVVEAHSGRRASLETLRNHCEEHGLAPADIGGLEDIIKGIVQERLTFVQERGMGAMGPLMGVVMQAAGGADGKEVSALLRSGHSIGVGVR